MLLLKMCQTEGDCYTGVSKKGSVCNLRWEFGVVGVLLIPAWSHDKEISEMIDTEKHRRQCVT